MWRWVVQMVVMVVGAASAGRRQLFPTTPQRLLSPSMVTVARTLLQEDLSGCFLTLIGGGSEATELLAQLATDLHTAYQVTPDDLNAMTPPNIKWKRSPCDAFLVVGSGASGTLGDYLEGDALPWNYEGRYVFFNSSCRRDLQPLATTRKMKKTEHAAFICEGRGGRAEVWTHWLFSAHTWRFVGHATPAHLNRLSTTSVFPAKLADLQGFPLVVKTFAFAPSVFGTLAEEELQGGRGGQGTVAEEDEHGGADVKLKEKLKAEPGETEAKEDFQEGVEGVEKPTVEEEEELGEGGSGTVEEEEDLQEETGGTAATEELHGGGGGGGIFIPEGGQDVSFVLLLAKHLNFTVQWRHPGPSLWGNLQEDGSYTGLVGQVGQGDGDLGVCNVFLDLLRTRHATFTYPYTYEVACFLTPAPQELPPWISLGSPFSPRVWIGLVLTFLLASLVTPLLAHLLASPPDLPQFYSWGRWLVYTVGIVTCQSQKVPLTDRLRVASLTLQFMGFVAAVSFSGNLTAYLTTPNVEAAIRSLQQLDDSGLEVVGFSNYWLDMFLASQNTHILSLARKYRAVTDTLPVFREVAEDRGAVLLENKNHLQFIQSQFYTTKRGDTPLRIQEECMATFGVSAALNKRSPLAPYINKAIHHMQAGGLSDKFFEEVLTQDIHGSVLHHEEGQDTWLDLHDQAFVPSRAKVLSVAHLLGAFLVLLVGYLLAAVMLALEMSEDLLRATPILTHTPMHQ